MKAARKEAGFTIVELLIATAVFSVVLLMMTFGILQVTNTFFKGDNEANTQRVATSVLDAISQGIEFNGGSAGIVGATNTVCIGSQQFSFWQGTELEQAVNGPKHRGLSAFVENATGCNGTRSATGRELLTDNMRLSNLKITCISSAALCAPGGSNPGVLYQVEVRIVYGDDDLLYSPSGASPAATAPDAACNGKLVGEQFCAVSDISTIVSERI
jgi:prepilin-type N-terminal cleavage/methylation domain-containing protein